MSIESYEDWNARKTSPGFKRSHVVKPTDSLELPEVLVLEEDAAAETIRRHLAAERRSWIERKLK
jgi:hypothetical protein